MVFGGDQRSTAAFVVRFIAAPVEPEPSWPMKRSVPLGSHLWPGVTPCTGIVPTGLALAQAASNAGAKNRVLRILRLLHGGSSHLKPAVLDPEGEPALDQVDRVLAELFVTPAGQDIEVLADAGGK